MTLSTKYFHCHLICFLSMVIDVFLAYGKKSVSKDFTYSTNSKELVLFLCFLGCREIYGMRGELYSTAVGFTIVYEPC